MPVTYILTMEAKMVSHIYVAIVFLGLKFLFCYRSNLFQLPGYRLLR